MLETVLSHFKSGDALSARHTILPPPRMFVEEKPMTRCVGDYTASYAAI